MGWRAKEAREQFDYSRDKRAERQREIERERGWRAMLQTLPSKTGVNGWQLTQCYLVVAECTGNPPLSPRWSGDPRATWRTDTPRRLTTPNERGWQPRRKIDSADRDHHGSLKMVLYWIFSPSLSLSFSLSLSLSVSPFSFFRWRFHFDEESGPIDERGDTENYLFIYLFICLFIHWEYY